MTEVHAFVRFLFLDVEFTGKCALLGGKRSRLLKSYNYLEKKKETKGGNMLLQPDSRRSCQYHPVQKTSRSSVIHPGHHTCSSTGAFNVTSEMLYTYFKLFQPGDIALNHFLIVFVSKHVKYSVFKWH